MSYLNAPRPCSSYSADDIGAASNVAYFRAQRRCRICGHRDGRQTQA